MGIGLQLRGHGARALVTGGDHLRGGGDEHGLAGQGVARHLGLGRRLQGGRRALTQAQAAPATGHQRGGQGRRARCAQEPCGPAGPGTPGTGRWRQAGPEGASDKARCGPRA
ncbi:hypothetical protein MANAM107_01580 [Actinomyces capricornis]|uniref:Uncharacterized protein n=1 Tax=Actinomyces capricornis TaxID=2755559 RepID=A0ABM7U728_9ACTO|nr:hypothetical protein MANAM107_01580 [Actinomyces capricornis]